jgi:hypothetical protein
MQMIDTLKPRKNIKELTKEEQNSLAEKCIDNSKKMISNLQF